MTTPTPTRAGPEMDALVAEKVMDWRSRGGRWMCRNGAGGYLLLTGHTTHDWKPSTDIAAAWRVVERVQTLHPGWRFGLLGGDRMMGYATDPKTGEWRRNRSGQLTVVESSSIPFGWRAEFFGDADPRLCTGQRHGEGAADTAPEAICRAVLAAIEGSKP